MEKNLGIIGVTTKPVGTNFIIIIKNKYSNEKSFIPSLFDPFIAHILCVSIIKYRVLYHSYRMNAQYLYLHLKR